MRYFASHRFFCHRSFALTPGASSSARTVAPDAPGTARAAQQISREVADAEAAIVKSDWKSAEAKLNAWLSAHPTDARALFDAAMLPTRKTILMTQPLLPPGGGSKSQFV
jgi:hypothetical protein